MLIHEVQADHYRIPLPIALSDSTHGTIRAFELITVRVRDTEGAEGMGYTYTVGAGGGAVHALIARDLAPLLAGREAERIEETWQAMWWALHYGGRGGAQVLAISAVDIALPGVLPVLNREAVAKAAGLAVADFDENLPIETVSTGVPFTITPIRSLAATLPFQSNPFAQSPAHRTYRSLKRQMNPPLMTTFMESID